MSSQRNLKILLYEAWKCRSPVKIMNGAEHFFSCQYNKIICSWSGTKKDGFFSQLILGVGCKTCNLKCQPLYITANEIHTKYDNPGLIIIILKIITRELSESGFPLQNNMLRNFLNSFRSKTFISNIHIIYMYILLNLYIIYIYWNT